jgi:hypothetical protein
LTSAAARFPAHFPWLRRYQSRIVRASSKSKEKRCPGRRRLRARQSGREQSVSGQQMDIARVRCSLAISDSPDARAGSRKIVVMPGNVRNWFARASGG